MTNLDLIVFSYHRFTVSEDEYVFSRTYRQFRNDLNTKDFDLITIDDGHHSCIKACKMMEESNIRAKIFVNPALFDCNGYCTSAEILALSKKHDIENHAREHVKLVPLDDLDIYQLILQAQDKIQALTGRRPRFFVPPWNHYDNRVEDICEELNLQIVKKRITIKNTTL